MARDQIQRARGVHVHAGYEESLPTIERFIINLEASLLEKRDQIFTIACRHPSQ